MNEQTFAQIEQIGKDALGVLIEGICEQLDPAVPKAILVKTVLYYNRALTEGWSAEEIRNGYVQLIKQTPVSFSLIGVVSIMIALSEYLDNRLRKDDTDERRHYPENPGPHSSN